MTARPGFEDVVRRWVVAPPLPMEDYLRDLDALIAAHDWAE